MLRTALVFAWVLAWTGAPGAALAQVGEGRLKGLPGSTRAMALGGAHVPDAGHPGAVFLHPALLRGATGMALDVQRWGREASAASAAAAAPWFGDAIGVGIGLRSLQHTSDGSAPSGVPAEVSDPLFEQGGTAVSERSVVVGLSGELGFLDDVSWGVSVGWEERRLDAERDADPTLGLGLARRLGAFTATLSAVDVTEGPEHVDLGLGRSGWVVGALDVGVAARVGRRAGHEHVSAGGGLEIAYWPIRGRTFVGRVGVQTVPDGSSARPLTLGLAYWGDTLVVEWGFQPFRGVADGGTHRISLGWR